MVLRPSVSKDSKSFALQHSSRNSRMPNEVYCRMAQREKREEAVILRLVLLLNGPAREERGERREKGEDFSKRERREKMFRSCHAHQPNLVTTVRDACCSISNTDRSFGSSSTARSAGCESQRARSCAGITSSPSTSAQQKTGAVVSDSSPED